MRLLTFSCKKTDVVSALILKVTSRKPCVDILSFQLKISMLHVFNVLDVLLNYVKDVQYIRFKLKT